MDRSHIFPQFQNTCSLACELHGLVCESFVLTYLEILLSFVGKGSTSLSSPLVMPSGSLTSYMVVDCSSELASPTRILFEVDAIRFLIDCASTNWAMLYPFVPSITSNGCDANFRCVTSMS